MKFLHTADWHIGQLFHEFDRTPEHEAFIEWLLETLQYQQVDVLLISGDIFDSPNPSSASVGLFYRFLQRALLVRPGLQIIAIAGNHDSAARLETPKPLLESTHIHLVGLIERDAEGRIDYSKLVIPLHNAQGEIRAWCIAIPYLRLGDYAELGKTMPYAEGVASVYQGAYEYAKTQQQKGQALIAMGHLHALHAEVSDSDKTERMIIGGAEGIPVSAFHEELCYVALGHIHKAQQIGGKTHVRYSGSPIPMSFSELNYKHQALQFELMGDDAIGPVESVEIPVSVPLLRIPRQHAALSSVLQQLRQLEPSSSPPGEAPFLEVRVLLEGPEPSLRHQIETALAGKNLRLTRIDVKYPEKNAQHNPTELLAPDHLAQLEPVDIFRKIWFAKYQQEAPDDMQQLFLQIAGEVAHTAS